MPETLRDIIDPVCIDLDLRGRRKGEIIGELVALLTRGGKISDSAGLASDVIEREKLFSTGIGNGIAIPHALSSAVDRTLLAIGVRKTGVKFDAVDNQPVRLFFLLVGPAGSESEHLKVLSRIARYLHDGTFRTALLDASSPQDVMAALASKEGTIP